jgi:hypothetical protein
MAAASEMISPKKVELESEKELLAKKLHLMKQMLKNERRANQLISNKLGNITTNMHMNNKTIQILSDQLRTSKRGVTNV